MKKLEQWPPKSYPIRQNEPTMEGGPLYWASISCEVAQTSAQSSSNNAG